MADKDSQVKITQHTNKKLYQKGRPSGNNFQVKTQEPAFVSHPQ